MNILVICGSSRDASQSSRVCEAIKERIYMKCEGVNTLSTTLAGNPLPFWNENYEKLGSAEPWKIMKEKFNASDAYIFVVPEWNGMVPPDVKNLFHLLDANLVGHKPALIVAVSSGDGGAYVVSEMRMASSKNNFLIYLPEHLIIRRVSRLFSDELSEADHPEVANVYARIDYSISILAKYLVALKGIRESGALNFSSFKYGM